MWRGYISSELVEGIDPELLWPYIKRLRACGDESLDEIISCMMATIYR